MDSTNLKEKVDPEQISVVRKRSGGVFISCALRVLLMMIGLAFLGLGIGRIILLSAMGFGIVQIVTGAALCGANLALIFRSAVSSVSPSTMMIGEITLCMIWLIMFIVITVSSYAGVCSDGGWIYDHGYRYFDDRVGPSCELGKPAFALAAVGLVLEVTVLGLVVKYGWMTARQTNDQWRKRILLRGGIFPDEDHSVNNIYYSLSNMS